MRNKEEDLEILTAEDEEAIDTLFDFMNFLNGSITMYHAVENIKNKLKEAGFKELKLEEDWQIKPKGKYYIIVNDSAIIGFRMGKDVKAGFNIVGTHTDSPGFKLKTNPTILTDEGYVQLNTEVYGGPLLHTWFDRPLSIAGRVFLKNEKSNKIEVKLLDITEYLLTIPSLAIHFQNQEELSKLPNPQENMMPIIALYDEFSIEELIAENLECDEESILSYDLFLYDGDEPKLMGKNSEFIQSSRLDNLGMTYAGMTALIKAKESKSTQVFVAFDNEEIGSGTLQGAGSTMFRDVLRKISLTLGNSEVEFINQIYKSLMISADQAHSIHPNYKHKADPTNRPVMNFGPVIKESARKSYATDGAGKAVIQDIAIKLGIDIQYFHNRSDLRGGSTIGSIIETKTGIKNVDIGNPILAMHSIKELCGAHDEIDMIKLMKGFFEEI